MPCQLCSEVWVTLTAGHQKSNGISFRSGQMGIRLKSAVARVVAPSEAPSEPI